MMSIENFQKVRRKLDASIFYSWFIVPLNLICSFVPSVGLAYPKHQKIFGMVYNIGNGSCGIIFGLLFSYSMGYLLHKLSALSKLDISNDISSKLEPAVKKLRLEYYTVTTTTFSGGLVILIFGASDYLLQRSTYLYLVFCIIYNYSVLEVIDFIPIVSTNVIKYHPYFSTKKVSPSCSPSKTRMKSTSYPRKSSLTAIMNLMRRDSISTVINLNKNNDDENILYFQTVRDQIQIKDPMTVSRVPFIVSPGSDNRRYSSRVPYTESPVIDNRRRSSPNNRRHSHGGLCNARRTTLTGITPIATEKIKIQENIYDIYSNIYDSRKNNENNQVIPEFINKIKDDGDVDVDIEALMRFNAVEKQGEGRCVYVYIHMYTCIYLYAYVYIYCIYIYL
jgi:hypothetical protein